jgi:hypothetical protein
MTNTSSKGVKGNSIITPLTKIRNKSDNKIIGLAKIANN